MESNEIKENRRAKFLSKMNFINNFNQNNYNTNTNNNLIYHPQNIPGNQSINNFYNNQYQYHNPGNNINNNSGYHNFNSFNTYQQNNVLNNSPNNYQFKYNNNENKINFTILLDKMNQFDYMINFQIILKKIFIIILTILHCLDYPPLNNSFIFKYTLIVLEMSSLLFNKYYNEQKKNLNKKNNINEEPSGQIEIIVEFLKSQFTIFNQFFYVIKFIIDMIIDFSILFIINVLFFIISNED